MTANEVSNAPSVLAKLAAGSSGVLSMSGMCRGNGAAVALEHAQLCCGGQDP